MRRARFVGRFVGRFVRFVGIPKAACILCRGLYGMSRWLEVIDIVQWWRRSIRGFGASVKQLGVLALIALA